ncbi:MAG: leucine--tRNA ligase [Prolixibacteraceae bacterium]|jgi:leucyl-tRNA synthetase|nr:leucine--tRNA ligase [Prolixibacteraceae bacterium]MBT6764399.1 leucine--tRNA ligase [Prolixibacteraceae bacterium]MBT6999940.1 leucine--tRNA ligase [Prolixibacteraceae bacterium]MBT7396868.1 leucine--tRNA ligase [Prolixibacteraceae bacterium]
MEYNFAEIEPKWQKYWDENKTFKTVNDFSKPKYYILDMFPYPSGAGLHVGHPEGYTATDIISRFKRMKGINVLHPMGYDAFGLPAEQYAIQTGTHPAETTNKNCDNFRRQIKSLGLSYDWDREINTTDPKYFKWTQWIFKQLYNTWFDSEIKKGRPIAELPIPDEIKSSGKEAINNYISNKRLAYYDNAQVWWCDSCKTVCANEEVLTDGAHEKCGNQVVRKNLKQWLLRIPNYAERLLQGLEGLDWPHGIKEAQKNWIGKSTGAEVDFEIDGLGKKLRVYTTRPDTLFGATYMVIAPEHAWVNEITTQEKNENVDNYIKAAALKSDLDRTDLAKEKTGVFTGRFAINPVNNEKIPIWVADYVLPGYGTGAIMAVPAHDTRDFEFAKEFNIPVICILDPENANNRDKILAGESCWTEDGEYINSSDKETGLNINGLNKADGIDTTIKWLESKNLGEATVNYKMRDWLFSRQRYWGEPFPVIHWEDGEVSLVNDNNLPLQLPELEKYTPGDSGESPLSNATDWLNITDENGRKGRRETNTMPQWAGSCWYFLRYIDPDNNDNIFDKAKEQYWMPVDLYVGGAEHAVLHLLYSRFWHKVLFDLGVVSSDEPFQKLFNQGMILAFAYKTSSGAKVASDLVIEKEGKFFSKETGDELEQIVAKMSKSLKNVVNPDDVTKYYGADSLRLYEMFMGPLDERKPWSENGVKGVFNFLNRAYRFFSEPKNIVEGDEDKEVAKLLNKTIQKVEYDIDHLKFNTAISALMVFNNLAIKKGKVTKKTAEVFALILSPFAPHLGEELWSGHGNKKTLAYETWPSVDEKLLKEDSFDYPVSFNGKMRFKLELALDMPKDEIEKTVLADERAQRWLEGKTVRKFILVPKKIINVVIG